MRISPDDRLALSQSPGDRPWRVLPLAIGAVLIAMIVAGLGSEAFHELSDESYAVEVLRDAVDA
jgi:hypothetical protein